MKAEGLPPAAADVPALVLASSSPRRRQLLLEAQLPHEAIHPGLDDAELAPGVTPAWRWVQSLAYLKGRAALERLANAGRAGDRVILAADTVCLIAGRPRSAPADAREARQMLEAASGGEHAVLTGVAVLRTDGQGRLRDRRSLLTDEASVRIGPLSASQIDEYIAGGQWAGKAGGYNLADRLAAGWPITFQGDPATIMGLPIRRLMHWAGPELRAAAARSAGATIG